MMHRLSKIRPLSASTNHVLRLWLKSTHLQASASITEKASNLNISSPQNDENRIDQTNYLVQKESKSPRTDKPNNNNKIPFTLNPVDIIETVTKGGGPGGQSINKSSNRVRLHHIPTGIIVTCQDFRDLTSNRKHAMTMLKEKVEFAMNGANSKLGKKIDKIRRRKAKRTRRTKAKQAGKENTTDIRDIDGSSDDEMDVSLDTTDDVEEFDDKDDVTSVQVEKML